MSDFDSKKLKDRKYKAEDYKVDTNLEYGAIPERRCTNLLCAIIFVVTMLSMFAMTIDGYVVGNPDKFTAPINKDGLLCGYDLGLDGYPLLYFADINAVSLSPTKAFTYGVCVESCPGNNDQSVNCTDAEQSYCDGFETYGTKEFWGYCVPVYDELTAA